ncbi:MAG: TIGR03943 family protein [Bacillus sp. (in: firmicutes)]
MSETRIKFHTYLRGIVLIGISLLLFKLLLTGNISLFISPKLYPLLAVSILLLMIVGIIQIFFGTSETTEVSCNCCAEHLPPKNTFRSFIYYSFFIIPVITGLLFSDHTLGSSIAKNREIQFVSSQAEAQQDSLSIQSNDQTQNTAAVNDTYSTSQQYMTQKEYDRLQQTLFQEKTIKVDDKRYVPTMGILENHLDQFIGKEVELTGFVYREKDFSANQVVLARFVITCCIADASVDGMMLQGNVAGLKNDSWIKVKGKITKTTFHANPIPELTVTSAQEIPAPSNPYVYDIGIKLN